MTAPTPTAAPQPPPRRVQLLATCLIETLRPQAGLAVVEVLESLGLAVDYPPGQTCCGQPAFNGGLWNDARAMARHTLAVLGRSDAPVVVPSGSCAAMIRRHYPELLASDAVYGPLAQAVAARTYEFSEFLVDVLGVTCLERRGSATAHTRRVAYHPSCHLTRELGVAEQPRRLLTAAPGVAVVELPRAEECCGFGGLFAVKMGAISAAMLERKLDAIEQSGADAVVGCDASCLLHIAGGLQRRGSRVATLHLAEALVP